MSSGSLETKSGHCDSRVSGREKKNMKQAAETVYK